MTTFLLNPGTGPVGGRPTLANAYENLTALLVAAGVPKAPWRRDVDDAEDDGRFAFLVRLAEADREVSVLVPGCSLSLLKSDGLNAPRLYVDGNSWWWKFAVSVLSPTGGEDP